MGNCFGGSDTSSDNSKNHTSMHQGMLRERQYDVYKKYEEIKVVGQGSMGHVAKVRVRTGQEGGSAYNSSGTNGKKGGDDFKKKSSSISSDNRHEYALKSIKLDRVSPMFVEELKNEINILKGMVRLCYKFDAVRIVHHCGYFLRLPTF